MFIIAHMGITLAVARLLARFWPGKGAGRGRGQGTVL